MGQEAQETAHGGGVSGVELIMVGLRKGYVGICYPALLGVLNRIAPMCALATNEDQAVLMERALGTIKIWHEWSVGSRRFLVSRGASGYA